MEESKGKKTHRKGDTRALTPPGERLARSTGMDAELMNLALQSPPEMMLDSAQYFQERGQPEKAVMLYHKVRGAGFRVQGF